MEAPLNSLNLSSCNNDFLRVGIGYDIHKISDSGKPFKLGGVIVSESLKIDAHSDGDTLFHSIADSLLGALGKGDIGNFFPNISKFENLNSIEILNFSINLVKENNYKINNIDSTVILQNIKLQDFVPKIIENISNSISKILGTSPIVNVKAKTKEGLDATGKGLSVECHSVVSLIKM